MTQKLSVTLERGIKRITFNRPERRNAVDLEMFASFGAALEESANDGTRVVVITGAGDSFCSGLDLTSIGASELAGMDIAATVRELINPPVLRMRALHVPVVACVNGPAVGIGFSYVLASDVRVASETATFSQSFARVGLMPDGGSTFFLTRLVGRAKAFELMASARSIAADEALRLGIVNAVVPAARVDEEADLLAAALASGPQPALARIKGAQSRQEREELSAALEYEAEGQAECFRSPDFAEGVAAFLQKRAPDFGRARAWGASPRIACRTETSDGLPSGQEHTARKVLPPQHQSERRRRQRRRRPPARRDGAARPPALGGSARRGRELRQATRRRARER
jgi:2-(1,2-epoxy-1,2-dihydrophenyl)acetyl-CoA isomerase